MQPYEFIPGSAQLVEQPSGMWVAQFEASVYSAQSFSETSNSVTSGVRVIEFEVIGAETSPVVQQTGESAPYTRGSETEVELVLTKGGKRKDSLRTYYP